MPCTMSALAKICPYLVTNVFFSRALIGRCPPTGMAFVRRPAPALEIARPRPLVRSGSISKVEFQTQLHLACRRSQKCDRAKIASAQVGIGGTKIRVVKDVEGFQPKL